MDLAWEDPTPFCLAQHHGIPTELLDWTSDPLTAAFFAADEAHDEFLAFLEVVGPDGPDRPSYDRLAVWALNTDKVPSTFATDGTIYKVIETINCPRAQHSFLHAQEGLFLAYRSSGQFYMQNGYWPVFEEVLEDVLKGEGGIVLKKFTLPIRLAGDLLQALWRRRYFRAKLMPTYDNVSKSLRRKWSF